MTIQRTSDHWSRILSPVFDETAYLDRYPDIREAGVVPFDHYVEFGLAEGRQPSLLFDPSYVRLRFELDPRDRDAVAEAIGRIDGESLHSTTPLLCPRWASLHIGRRCDSLSELLAVRLEEGAPFSPNPILRVEPVPTGGATVSDLVCALNGEAVRTRSLVDPDAYVAAHRDLAGLAGQPLHAFAHMFSFGLRENRLKYLGTSTPKSFSEEQIFCATMAVVTLRTASVAPVDADDSLARLPEIDIEAVPGDDLNALRRLKYADPLSIPSLEAVFEAQRVIGRGDALLLVEPDTDPDAPEEPLSAPAVAHAEEMTDLDLLSGRLDLSGQRVVYSVNLGSYDLPPEPPEMDACDYIMITDGRVAPKGSPWRLVRSTLREADIKRRCLWYKTHPSQLFGKAEFSIWIDSNVACLPGSDRVLQAHEALSEVATFRHPDRDCVYKEAEEILKLHMDHEDLVHAAIGRLEAEGFPRAAGLYETNVLFARCSDMGVQDFMDAWWRRIALGARRDQLSFTPAALETGVHISELDGTHSAKTSRFFRKRDHISKAGRFVK